MHFNWAPRAGDEDASCTTTVGTPPRLLTAINSQAGASPSAEDLTRHDRSMQHENGEMSKRDSSQETSRPPATSPHSLLLVSFPFSLQHPAARVCSAYSFLLLHFPHFALLPFFQKARPCHSTCLHHPRHTRRKNTKGPTNNNPKAETICPWHLFITYILIFGPTIFLTDGGEHGVKGTQKWTA